MEKIQVKYYRIFMLSGILLIVLGLVFPYITLGTWFDIIYKIRKAINVGDSGHLILASALASFLNAVQSTLLFLGAILAIFYTKIKLTYSKFITSITFLAANIILHLLNSKITNLPWEPAVTVMALIIALFIFEKLFDERNSFIYVSIVAIQVFFAFQWLNIMPLFSPYHIGQSDIPYSIKIAGLYLQSASVLNFTGFAFFLPFICSAFISATLFISYSRNINMVRDNYEKEKEIQNMKAKILENRIYAEVKSLVHDLKTPLVTIRGLNSLLAVSKDSDKIEEYSGRIENSVERMNEMISSFLFETSRQRLQAADLINYIRAQLPLEDETIKIDLKIADNLPDIYVNKIRMARAVINILENAIIVPHKHLFKHIVFEIKPADQGLYMIIQDNGIGIKEEDLHRIWEVGFSTNNTSGLGLPFAKQIIEDNEGTIEIFSKQDIGTTVTIFLPSADAEINNQLF